MTNLCKVQVHNSRQKERLVQDLNSLPYSEKVSKHDSSDGPLGFEFVLPFLDTSSRFKVERVNKSLNGAMKDPLLWTDLILDSTICKGLTDKTLLELVGRAEGLLKTLSLINATKVTDAVLSPIFKFNPQLQTISIQGVSEVKADTIVNLIEAHSLKARAKGLPGIRQIRVAGVFNITDEHLLRLDKVLDLNNATRNMMARKPRYYGNNAGTVRSYCLTMDDRDLDLEICPLCGNVQLLFDCTNFKTLNADPWSSEYGNWAFSLDVTDCRFSMSCRSCLFCITRCEDCGICVRLDPFSIQRQYNQTLCGDLLCISCSNSRRSCVQCGCFTCSYHERICFSKSDELCIFCTGNCLVKQPDWFEINSEAS